MKMLVTGGFGYLGGRLASYLSAAGHEVILGSRQDRKSPDWLPEAKTVVTNWSSSEALATVCEGQEVVLHAAGMNAADCARDPEQALAFNGGATGKLVSAAVKTGVRRFVYISTAHVYASPLVGRVTETSPVTNPHPYATSHLAGEKTVEAAQKANRIEGVSLRLSNTFGEPMDETVDCWTLFTNQVTRQAITERKVTIRNAPNSRRDFLPMREACRVISAIVELPTAQLSCGTYNVGQGQSLSLEEMARLVKDALASHGVFVDIEQPGPVVGPVDLEFSISRLIGAGIPAPSVPATHHELDRLIEYCLEMK